MSIDYDQLRELVDAATPGPWRADDESLCECCTDVTAPAAFVCTADTENAPLIALAPDMARELLRLRDESSQLLAKKRAAVKRLYSTDQVTAAVLEGMCDELAFLLNGDAE